MNPVIDEELRALLEANAAESRRQFEHLETTLREHVAETANRLEKTLRDHVAETAAETRLHNEILNEATRHEVRLVAEKVVLLDEKLDREAADIRAEMRNGFEVTHAMLRFSHADLDRRVTVLEDGQRTID
jgi:hypothetical protein